MILIDLQRGSDKTNPALLQQKLKIIQFTEKAGQH